MSETSQKAVAEPAQEAAAESSQKTGPETSRTAVTEAPQQASRRGTPIAMAPAVLVTGMIRSGTTWVGRVLATTQDTIYIHEPFNPDSPWNATIPTPMHYLYLNDITGWPWVGRFRNLLNLTPRFSKKLWVAQARAGCLGQIERGLAASVSGQLRPVIKDPIAIFSAEWIIETFDLKAVFVLRHPIMVAKSLLKLGWIHAGVQARWWQSQPLLRERFFADLAADLERAADDEALSLAERACWYVRLVLIAERVLHRDHPEWLFVSYEDLLDHAATALPALIQHFGLAPTVKTDEIVSGTGVYDANLAHQKTQKPIPFDRRKIWAADAHHDDWRALYERFFRDLEEGFSDVVVWSD